MAKELEAMELNNTWIGALSDIRLNWNWGT